MRLVEIRSGSASKPVSSELRHRMTRAWSKRPAGARRGAPGQLGRDPSCVASEQRWARYLERAGALNPPTIDHGGPPPFGAAQDFVVAAADFCALEGSVDGQHDLPSERMRAERADRFKLSAAAIFVQAEAFAQIDWMATPVLAPQDVHAG